VAGLFAKEGDCELGRAVGAVPGRRTHGTPQHIKLSASQRSVRPDHTCARSASLVATILNAATLTTAGKTVAGAVSAQAALLTTGALRAMFLKRLKTVAATLLGVSLLNLGVGGSPAKVAARHEGDQHPASRGPLDGVSPPGPAGL
jgi:hypothetical protein